MGTLNKGLIGQEDINYLTDSFFPAPADTFSRSGNLGVSTMTKVPNPLIHHTAYYNPLYHSTTKNDTTISLAIAAIAGSSVNTYRTIYLEPGVWSINNSLTIPATVRLLPDINAIMTIATGKTLTINGSFCAGLYQVFSLTGTGTVRFGPGSVKEIVPQWFGASPSATAAVNSAAFQAALDSMGTYPSIPLYIPGASTGSVGNYDINVALTKTSADWIRIRGDGAGSWLEWTGADYATILSLTGLGSGMAEIDGVRFDCNAKATTGLQMKGFGHEISVTKCMFNDGLANVADDQGMLNIPIDGETHNGKIQGNWFSGGTAIGLALGLTGASSGSGGFDISVNEFQQINNWAVKSDGLKESALKHNIVDQVITNANGGGFNLDSSSGLDILNNHMEACAQEFILLNPTARYAFKPVTGRILGNTFVSGAMFINLGYTDGVEVAFNTILDNTGISWLTVTANAFNTTVGKNELGTTAGSKVWHEQYIGGAGLWNNRYGYTTVAPDTAVLSLTGQSASAAWVEKTPLSTAQTPNIPTDIRAVVVQASIMSATVGARLYMVNEGNAPLWANRATDMRVQYIEAQTANRYNTATFIIPIKNTSYEDAIYYSIDPTGVNDTAVQLRIVGYLMPT